MPKLLSQLKAPHGATHSRKRLGRGNASGRGGTSTKGHKGQLARSGGLSKMGFEGGQMPLARRLPKRGFTNIFKKQYAVLNLSDLAEIPAGTDVNAEYLLKNKKIRKVHDGIKILGNGEIKVALNIEVAKISKSAREKIEQAGGKVQLIAPEPKSAPAPQATE